jgi:CRP-like cAMP-binding protein
MRLTTEDIALVKKTLDGISLFKYFTPAENEKLMEAFDKVPMRKGQVLIEQGAPGSIFYIVASGAVAVVRKREFVDKKVSTLQAGEFFGEMSLINNEPRNAAVVCEEDGVLVTLFRDTFRNIIMANPHVAQEIMRIASQRKEEILDIEAEDRLQRYRAKNEPPPQR